MHAINLGPWWASQGQRGSYIHVHNTVYGSTVTHMASQGERGSYIHNTVSGSTVTHMAHAGVCWAREAVYS